VGHAALVDVGIEPSQDRSGVPIRKRSTARRSSSAAVAALMNKSAGSETQQPAGARGSWPGTSWPGTREQARQVRGGRNQRRLPGCVVFSSADPHGRVRPRDGLGPDPAVLGLFPRECVKCPRRRHARRCYSWCHSQQTSPAEGRGARARGTRPFSAGMLLGGRGKSGASIRKGGCSIPLRHHRSIAQLAPAPRLRLPRECPVPALSL
jgi:hypothetical protein